MNLSQDANELDFLRLFLSDEMIASFVTESNRYAEQKQQRSGPDQNWIPISVPEMKAWLGLRIYMSIFVLPTQDMYWSTDWLFGNTFAGNVMKRGRFDKITSYFHVSDTTINPPREQPGMYSWIKEGYNYRCFNIVQNSSVTGGFY